VIRTGTFFLSTGFAVAGLIRCRKRHWVKPKCSSGHDFIAFGTTQTGARHDSLTGKLRVNYWFLPGTHRCGAPILGIIITETSDEDLIHASRAGERSAMDALYSRHHGDGLRFARRLMASRSDAEDVAQDAFLKVMAAIERGKGPEAMFRPYFLRTVRTAAMDRWEEQAREVPTDATVEAPVEDVNLASLLHRAEPGLALKAFQSLPPRWMAVLWHAEVEKEPPRRIAPVLGLEPGAVSALLLRARRGLREAYLTAYSEAPPHTDCEPTFSFLAATVLGTASARDRRKVKEHTRDCEDCAKVLAELTDVGATMRGILAPMLLLPAAAAPGPQTLPKSRTPTPLAAAAAAAIIAVLSAAAMLGGLSRAGSSTPVQATETVTPSASQSAPSRPPATTMSAATITPSLPEEPANAQEATSSDQDNSPGFLGPVPVVMGNAPGRSVLQRFSPVPHRGAANGGPDHLNGPSTPQQTAVPTALGKPTPTTNPTITPTISPTKTPSPTGTPTPIATPTTPAPTPNPTGPGLDPGCTELWLWCLVNEVPNPGYR
jgi:RNA polymerase sigma factor (sigma-70 family)